MQLFREPPDEAPLRAALEERAEVIDRKQRVLEAFRSAQGVLGDRRRRDAGHTPERRGA